MRRKRARQPPRTLTFRAPQTTRCPSDHTSRLCASLEGKEKEKAGLFEVPLFVLMTIVSGPYCFGEDDPATAISMLAT